MQNKKYKEQPLCVNNRMLININRRIGHPCEFRLVDDLARNLTTIFRYGEDVLNRMNLNILSESRKRSLTGCD